MRSKSSQERFSERASWGVGGGGPTDDLFQGWKWLGNVRGGSS